ncbi:CpaE family protein [Herbaspirillum sp. GCM10030257]|uniref:AAA family ATPase n=1 Tax=Herbaspirillum sp. GCM10030257 TaxID=3273393 RepID=UPI00360E79A2
MKIVLISANKNNTDEVNKAVQSGLHTLVPIDHGFSSMRTIVEQEQPDLLLIDDACTGTEVFDQIEYISMQRPNTAIILISANHTRDYLLNAMRAGIREVLLSPVSAQLLEIAVSRVSAKLPGVHNTAAGKVLAFMSCKGGSGATFLATNLGYQLAEDRKVLLIDLNLQFGDALSFLHDGKPASTLASIARDIRRLDGSFLAASSVRITENYSILAAPEDLSEAVDIKPAHIDAILNLAVTQYDFVLLDVGRTVDPVSIKALDHAYRIFPVLQAGLPYLRNTKKLLDTFNALGYPAEKAELIVNRFDKRGDIGVDDIRRLAGSTRLHTVPNSYKDVSTSINQGNPLIKTASSNTVSRILADITAALNPRPEASRGFFGRILKRA